MLDVHVDKLTLRLRERAGVDPRRLAEAIAAALAALGGVPGPLVRSSLRLRVDEQPGASEDELAAHIARRIMRATATTTNG